MVTNELIEYIKGELDSGILKEEVISSLLEAGWYKEDIDEGFLKIEKIKNPEVKRQIDPYRELPEEEGEPLAFNMKIEEPYTPIVRSKVFNYPIIEAPFSTDFTEETPVAEEPVSDDVLAENLEKDIYQSETPLVYSMIDETFIPEKTIVSKQIEETPVVQTKVVEKEVVQAPVLNTQPKEEPIIYNPVDNTPKIDSIIEVPIVNTPVVQTKVVEKEVVQAPVLNTQPKEEPIIYNPVISRPQTITELPATKNNPVVELEKVNTILVAENKKIENPVDKIETPVINEIKKEVEPSRIWIPTAIKPIENVNLENKTQQEPQLKPEPIKVPVVLEVKIETPKVEIPKEQTPKVEIKKIEIPTVSIPPTKTTYNNSQFDIIPPAKKDVLKEFIPTINKTPSVSNIPSSKISDISKNSAMISSYRQALLSSVEKEEQTSVVSNKKNWPLKVGILILILTLIGGMVFAFIEGYIKIPGAKASFLIVKKDPKVLVLGATSSISKLKSYKTETKINISSPSFSNITAGLSSGDVVNSKDQESISINAKGLVNNDKKTIFDYIFDIKSSILKNNISTNIKGDGTNLYMTVPDLSQILGEDTPEPTTLSLEREQVGLVINELSPETQALVKKIDVYNILSNKAPDYVTNELSFIFKDFIETFEYVNKGEENIHGIDTYHYGVNVTKASTKKLFSSLSGLFFSQLNNDEKKVLDEAIGASNISSFEIWTGKDNDNLYQVKFTINAPLSKVLGLNDSGIAGNEVKLDWITTFYDLDIENKINIPKGEVDALGFVKNIRNIKIKNIMSSFKSQATIFKNAVGSYGKKANSLGSCMMPVAGSMFSAVGHNKGADGAVGTISSTLNSLLLITKEEGFCYSTPSAWALIVPLSTEPISYYCADSLGNKTTIFSPVSETSCVSTKVNPL